MIFDSGAYFSPFPSYPKFLKYSTKVKRNGCTKALKADNAMFNTWPATTIKMNGRYLIQIGSSPNTIVPN